MYTEALTRTHHVYRKVNTNVSSLNESLHLRILSTGMFTQAYPSYRKVNTYISCKQISYTLTYPVYLKVYFNVSCLQKSLHERVLYAGKFT